MSAYNATLIGADELATVYTSLSASLETTRVILSLTLTTLSLVGVSLWEIGCVRDKNTQFVLAKNALLASIAGVFHLLYGYAAPRVFTGDSTSSAFLLTSDATDDASFAVFSLEAIIVSSAALVTSSVVAERMDPFLHPVLAFLLAGVVLPVVRIIGFQIQNIIHVEAGNLQFVALAFMTAALCLAGTTAAKVGPRMGRYAKVLRSHHTRSSDSAALVRSEQEHHIGDNDNNNDNDNDTQRDSDIQRRGRRPDNSDHSEHSEESELSEQSEQQTARAGKVGLIPGSSFSTSSFGILLLLLSLLSASCMPLLAFPPSSSSSTSDSSLTSTKHGVPYSILLNSLLAMAALTLTTYFYTTLLRLRHDSKPVIDSFLLSALLAGPAFASCTAFGFPPYAMLVASALYAPVLTELRIAIEERWHVDDVTHAVSALGVSYAVSILCGPIARACVDSAYSSWGFGVLVNAIVVVVATCVSFCVVSLALLVWKRFFNRPVRVSQAREILGLDSKLD
eukprot:ANDGO_02912.mRNA.1 Ammonium transporter 1 member 3